MRLGKSIEFNSIKIGEIFAITRDRSYKTNPGVCSCTLLSSMLSPNFKCCCKYKYTKKIEIYYKIKNSNYKNSIFLADDWDDEFARDGYGAWEDGYPGEIMFLWDADHCYLLDKRVQRYWYRKENDGIS